MAERVPEAGSYSAGGHANYTLETRFRREFETVMYCKTAIGMLATNNVLEPLKECGNEIEWRTAPRAKLHWYHKNQPLKVDFPEMGKNKCKIGRAKYWNIKIDDVDERDLCDMQEMVRLYQEDAIRKIQMVMQKDLIREMLAGAHPKNQGHCAGVKKEKCDLGTCDDCCEIDCDNIRLMLPTAHVILGQQCAVGNHGMKGTEFNDIDMPFAIVPPSFRLVMAQAMSKGCCPQDSLMPIDSGMIRDTHAGFDLYEVTDLPCHVNDKGQIVYPIIFGRKDATGWVTTMDKTEKVKHPDYFAYFLRGLIVWGGCVIVPEALGVLWACFDVPKLKKS